MEAGFCVEAVEEALARHGKPEIFNTDQGSQGGFKRSSQHFDRGGCDEEAEAAFGSVRARCSSVARSALRGAT
ncbi:hypothetical protein N826_36940 [Skermanella aerolata KACC 11604]|nr:hypothetical protein N826_36940 [Skermanella aerolata KACC 11604]